MEATDEEISRREQGQASATVGQRVFNTPCPDPTTCSICGEQLELEDQIKWASVAHRECFIDGREFNPVVLCRACLEHIEKQS